MVDQRHIHYIGIGRWLVKIARRQIGGDWIRLENGHA